MILQGPSGSASGTYYQDSDVIAQGSVISAIGICQSNYINGIAIQYAGNTLVRGKNGPDWVWFELDQGEYITGFGGNYGGDLNQLILYTNLRSSPLYGSQPTSANFCYMIPDGYSFGGFIGREDSSQIYALGYVAYPQAPAGISTSQAAIRMGPCGDAGGDEWLEVAPPGGQIQTINVWATDTDICCIDFLYQYSGALPKTTTYGKESGSQSSITLNLPNEYITGISGTVAGNSTGNLNTLTITTNQQRAVTFGTTAGPLPFTLTAPTGSQVVGFIIRSGSKVDALGIYTAPVASSAPVFEPVSNNTLLLRTPAAAVFNNYLYAILPPGYPGNLSPVIPSGPLQISNVSLSKLNADATLPIPPAPGSSLWETTCSLAVNSGYTDLNTYGNVSAAVVGASLFIYWQDDKGLMVVQFGATDDLSDPKAWKPWCQLQDDQGSNLPSSNMSDVSAVALDTGDVLVGTIFNGQVYIGWYAVADMQAQPQTSNSPGVWKARQSWTFTLAQLQLQTPLLKSCGDTLALEWYSSGGGQAWLAIGLWDSGQHDAFLYWLPLDIVSLPLMYLGNTAISPTVQISGQTIAGAYSPLGLRKDPAGRVRIYTTGPSSLLAFTQPSNVAPSGLEMDWLPLTDDHNHTFTPNTAVIPSNPPLVAPAPVFTASSAEVLTTVVNDPDNPPNATNPAFPVAETVFLPDQAGSQWYCASRSYGRLQSIPNIVGTPQPQTMLAVKGITDGPIPIPNENTIPYQFPGGFSNDCGDVVYGTAVSASQTRTFSYAWTVGIQSSGQSTKGLGPCWNISFSGGTGGSSSTSTATQLVKNVIQKATLETNQSVSNQGTLFATGITFNTSLYRFLSPYLDGSGNYQVAKDAATFILTAATFVGENDQNFVPYDVTPGNLPSYTREAWNSRMQQLGYAGTDYFDAVIVANAYQFATETNYLEFDWTQNSEVVNGFSATDSSLHESSWTFNSSIYVGISYGEEVSFLGMGENMQAQYMAGVTVSLNGNTQTQTQEQWGLTLQSLVCPPPTANKPGYLSYTGRIYFLPASSQWTEELLAYGDANLKTVVDPNSQPWRIVYQVTAYKYQDADGNITIYPPASAPATPATAPVIDTDGSGNVVGAYDNDGHSLWTSDDKVQYAISFVNAAGESQLSAWSPAALIAGSICAGVTLPVDPTAATTSRNLYRQFVSSPKPELVLTILDNTTTHVFDEAPEFNFSPPTQAPAIPTPASQWAGRSNFPNSAVWIPNNQVQYAVSYLYAKGETEIGPYCDWYSVQAFAFPDLSNVLLSQDVAAPGKNYPVCIGRNIYRNSQGPGPNGSTITIETNVLVATVSDNTTTTAQDPPPSAWVSSVNTGPSALTKQAAK